jgi:hypothetical protein
VELHPQVVLRRLLAENEEALSLVHAGLDWAVQETCSMWVDKRPSLYAVHANIFAGDVRQCLLTFLDRPEFRNTSLRAEAGSNCSVVLSDKYGGQMIVRKHPRNYLTGHLVIPTDFPEQTLWGVDYSTWPWRPYVLWHADLTMQALGHAWLGAVHGMDDPKGAEVYDRFDLPPAIIPAGTAPPSGDEFSEGENWDDEFEAERPSDPA